MSKGNVLVIGNSGVGKSTLINSVLGEEKAEVGWGTDGTTKGIKVYENEGISFRLIDTIGFEPAFLKKQKAIHAVNKWCKNGVKAGHEDSQINVVWFCVDGCAKKLFPDALKSLSSAISMWKSVPVIVVITKSYSLPERKENIEMVHQAFASMKGHSVNLKKVIPVVADTFVLSENAYASPEGISELIEATNNLMPEGIKAAEKDVAMFVLNRKRVAAQAVTSVATAAGAVVGAIPIPFADAAILGPTEVVEINSIARIYGIKNNEESKVLLNSIIEAGTVGAAAKAVIGALKAVPGINLAAATLNAIIAGFIIAALGEASSYIFEQIYLGNKSVADIDWVKKIMDGRLSNQLLEKLNKVLEEVADGMDPKDIAKELIKVFEIK